MSACNVESDFYWGYLDLAKYLARTCPSCKDYLGVVVRDPPGPKSEIPID